MRASSTVYCNRSCLCVCVFVAGGPAVSKPYYSQRARSVCVSLSPFFIVLFNVTNSSNNSISYCTAYLLCPAPIAGALSDACVTSVAYIGPKSRTERPRKTKIGTEVAHVTRDSDTTFEIKRSKINLQGAGHIVAASHTACLF